MRNTNFAFTAGLLGLFFSASPIMAQGNLETVAIDSANRTSSSLPSNMDNGFGNPAPSSPNVGLTPPPFDGCSGPIGACGTPTGPSTSVPEPEMAGMLLFGFAGLWIARRVRRPRRKS